MVFSGLSLGKTKVVLAIIVGIGLAVNVAPCAGRKIGINVDIFQFFFRRVPGTRWRFAENSAREPVTLNGLVFDLSAFAGHRAVEDLGPSFALRGCVFFNTRSS